MQLAQAEADVAVKSSRSGAMKSSPGTALALRFRRHYSETADIADNRQQLSFPPFYPSRV